MARLNISPGEAVGYHADFVDSAPEKLPDWTRNWIVDALTPKTVVHERYRKMEWDLDADIRKGAPQFRPASGYSSEEAAYDLRQIWRRLLRRYAFREACSIEEQLWKAEKGIWDGFSVDQRKLHGNPWLFRIWRVKDLLIWRLGLAVLVGFGLLASSSGTMKMLSRLHDRGLAWTFIGVELAIVFLLALVEVQRRVGRRPWRQVLCWRAFVITSAAVVWALPSALLHWYVSPPFTPSSFITLCASTAVLMGFVFQLFWQDGSIAEPL